MFLTLVSVNSLNVMSFPRPGDPTSYYKSKIEGKINRKNLFLHGGSCQNLHCVCWCPSC
jgi:hypothetical protein